MINKTLNVGCGTFPNGDINCDLFIKDIGHRDGCSTNRYDLHTKKIKNFVLCDGQKLPFKTNSFETVISSHTIEHVPNPIEFLNELVRVSKNTIVIKCPHWLGDRLNGKNTHHIHFFKSSFFKKYADKKGLFYYKTTNTIKRNKKTYIYSLLGIPNEIEIIYIKPQRN